MKSVCDKNGKRCVGHGPGHRFTSGKAPEEVTTLVEAVGILRARGMSDDQILTAIGKAVNFDFRKAGFVANGGKGERRAQFAARASKRPVLASAADMRAVVHGVARDCRTLANVSRENRGA